MEHLFLFLFFQLFTRQRGVQRGQQQHADCIISLSLWGLERIMAFMVLFSQVQPEVLLEEDAGLTDREVFYSTTCYCICVQGG